MIEVPPQFKNDRGVAYFNLCEQEVALAAFSSGTLTHVRIYTELTGDEVLAWWYPDCGLPEGVFAVGTAHPTTCGSAFPAASSS